MGLAFKNEYAIDVGTSWTELYAMSGDNITYSVISGMTIANKKLNEILIDVRIVDSTNLTTAYLCVNSKLSVGSSLCLAGDLQKIILKSGDSIEISSNENTSVDVVMSIIENDTSISFGNESYIWFGDLSLWTAGESNGSYISEYIFSTNTMSTNIGTWNPAYQFPASASNATIMLVMGGYSSYTRYEIRSQEFSSKAINYSWGTLYSPKRLVEGCSNGSEWVILGGYGVSGADDIIQKGTFVIGETISYFGDMSWGSHYYQGSAGNDVFALTMGYYNSGTTIHYIEYASEANSNYWGNMVYSSYANACVSNEEKILHNTGFSNTNLIYEISLASLGNSTNFGTLANYQYEAGGCADGLLAMFAGGENSNYSSVIDMYSAASFASPQTYYFDGGRPIAESGNA